VARCEVDSEQKGTVEGVFIYRLVRRSFILTAFNSTDSTNYTSCVKLSYSVYRCASEMTKILNNGMTTSKLMITNIF